MSSYYEILWEEVNIEEINNELMEFQNRCSVHTPQSSHDSQNC